MTVQKTKKTAEEVGRLRWPTSCAVSRSEIQSFPGSPKSNLHILSISNGTHVFSRSNYVPKYRLLVNLVNFRISCQIAIRRPAPAMQYKEIAADVCPDMDTGA